MIDDSKNDPYLEKDLREILGDYIPPQKALLNSQIYGKL
jgi:hypothetical protein